MVRNRVQKKTLSKEEAKELLKPYEELLLIAQGNRSLPVTKKRQIPTKRYSKWIAYLRGVYKEITGSSTGCNCSGNTIFLERLAKIYFDN